MAESQRLICASADLSEGGRGVRFEIERNHRSEPAFVIRYRGRVHAYLNRCAHVPIELDWNEGEFFADGGLYLICAMHGTLYDPATGACRGGRCPGSGLRPLPVYEADGNVYLVMQEGG